jgi:hypothetical protein
MTKTIIIMACSDCPYLDEGEIEFCTLTDELPTFHFIPDWCPLPETPIPAEPRKNPSGQLTREGLMTQAMLFYNQEMACGNTQDITSNDEPDYSLPFYQNIFGVMVDFYLEMKEK